MNCADFQDNVVACLEELLDAEQSRRCQAHLDTCAACRAEYASMKRLQGRLVASGQAAAGVSLVEPVMRRIDQMQRKPERTSIMNTLLKHRWSFGFGAVASAAAASVLLFALATPRAQAKAEEILARGARAIAKLTSIHLRGQLRTLPADNFSYISAESELYPIELWKQFEPDLKWRIEKPGRVAVMDGQQTLLYIKPPAKMAFKVPVASPSAFDTDWLHRIANLSQTIEDELRLAKAKGWKLGLSEERAADGRLKEIVTVEAKSGLPENDYMKDKFFETADTRRTYRFDA